MHSFYLRNMYQRNRLREPGGITLRGVPIDLRKIRVPSYFLSTREDHIALWKSTYAGRKVGSTSAIVHGWRHRRPSAWLTADWVRPRRSAARVTLRKPDPPARRR